MPVVVGMSNLREVREAVAAWRWAKDEGDKRSSSAALRSRRRVRCSLGNWV